MRVRLIILLLTVIVSVAPAVSQETAEPEQIRQVMRSAFDRPDARLEVHPIVVVAGHAIADWTQGDMGGRALLRRRNDVWSVVLCGGDQLKEVKALLMAGVPESAAKELTERLAREESETAPARIAMLSRFENLVAMDGHGDRPKQ